MFESHQSGIETWKTVKVWTTDRAFESHQSGIETGQRCHTASSPPSLNRTRVELKRDKDFDVDVSQWSLNRTRVELKLLSARSLRDGNAEFESHQSGIETPAGRVRPISDFCV